MKISLLFSRGYDALVRGDMIQYIYTDVAHKNPLRRVIPLDLISDEHNYEKNIRYFWDGGIMSNTPLTQLVRLHRLYWLKVKGLRDTVPKLEIGIVNVHPVKQDTIPWDHDGVKNRNSDITFSDRTEREQQALLLVSDYVDLARE